MARQTKYDLEDRLISYSCLVIDVVEALPDTKSGNHIGNQFVRSGTAAAPNYGEALAAESRRDFIHKMSVCLKELRESRIWLRVVQKKRMVGDQVFIEEVLEETRQLIAIFGASLETAKRNRAD